LDAFLGLKPQAQSLNPFGIGSAFLRFILLRLLRLFAAICDFFVGFAIFRGYPRLGLAAASG
jgi:hypothetical protein